MEESKEDTIERIKKLTSDKDHIHGQAMRLAGIYLQGAKDEILEREGAEIDESESEIYEACSNQLDKIGDEIVRLGEELTARSKEIPCQGLGTTYLLGDTTTSTHRVQVDNEEPKQVIISQRVEFVLVSDEIEMLIAVLRGVKADKNIPHQFFNINERYGFFYEPGGAGNAFTIRHTATGRAISMEPRIAYKLFNALMGKTEHLTRIGKGGAPFAESTRRKVRVQIQERNNPPCPNTFDTTATYPSDALPEWFSHLQPIVEDTTFTSMEINLGEKTYYYHISLVKEDKKEELSSSPPDISYPSNDEWSSHLQSLDDN